MGSDNTYGTYPRYPVCLDTAYDHSLTDEEYRISSGLDYLYFEIVEPEVLAYTFKVLNILVLVHLYRRSSVAEP